MPENAWFGLDRGWFGVGFGVFLRGDFWDFRLVSVSWWVRLEKLRFGGVLGLVIGSGRGLIWFGMRGPGSFRPYCTPGWDEARVSAGLSCLFC